jgi:hypothetical protein
VRYGEGTQPNNLKSSPNLVEFGVIEYLERPTLNAITGIAPDFACFWMSSIEEKQDSGKEDEIPDLHKILELFRNNRRLVNAQKVHGAHSAFARKTYLIEYLSPKDWKPDPAIQKRIDKKI